MSARHRPAADREPLDGPEPPWWLDTVMLALLLGVVAALLEYATGGGR